MNIDLPLDAAPEEVNREIEPVAEVVPVVEEVIAPVTEPLESEHIVETAEVVEEEVIVEEVIDNSIEESVEDPVVIPEETTPSETTPEVEENKIEPEKTSKLEGLGGLEDLSGGSGNEVGEVGKNDGTETVGLSTGGDSEIPNGWGIEREPNPAVKESGEVTISVEFNRSGHVVQGSVKFVSGNFNLFNANKDIITKSLEEELKFKQTDTSEIPKSRNKATFRFEFKGH